MDTMISYVFRTLPGIVALVLFLLVLPRRAGGLRVVTYIGLFVVIRDAMTPMGLWSFGTDGFFWIRFTDSLPLLFIIGGGSALIAVLMLVAEPGWRARIRWIRPRATESAGELVEPISGPPLLAAGASLGMGVLGALLTAGPLLLIYTGVPIGLRGGAVAARLLPGIAAVALLGNFYEELLFRGFLQDYFQEELGMAPLRAAVTSGIAFAAGHAFLASTVTDVGAPLLLFALYEGVIAGVLRMRWGLLAAVVSHGGAILLLAGGVV